MNTYTGLSMIKNLKVILLAFFIGVIILSFNNIQTIGAEEEKIKIQNFDKNKIYDSIPTHIFLDRNDSDWKEQSLADKDFDRKQLAIKNFVTSSNGEIEEWDAAMKITATTTHNFDVITGQAGNGFELVGLVATKQKLSDAYNATQSEKRLHNWIETKYESLDSIEDIDQRISEITNGVELRLVKQVVDAFNKQARHGNVPGELIETDASFWIITAGIAICQYDLECDVKFPTKVRDQKLYENKIPDSITSFRTVTSIFDYFLPLAYAAWVDANHHTYAYADPWQCEYGNCKKSYSNISTGTHNIFASSDGNHGAGSHVDTYVGSCGNSSGAGSYNVIAADFEIGFNTCWSAFDTGYGCAIDSITGLELDNNPDAIWLWSLSGTSDAHIDN